MKTIEAFAAAVEANEIASLYSRDCACEANLNNAKTKIKVRRLYTLVDVGSSGRYMVENATGLVYGIKAYGVIHRGHFHGTLEEATARMVQSVENIRKYSRYPVPV